MKTIVRLTLVASLLVLCSATASAQKFGYINSQELISLMPETDSAVVKIEKLRKELSDQLETLNVEYNKKVQELSNTQATLSQAVSDMKVKEINDIQTRLQEMSQLAQQQLQKEQSDLLAPIYDKADKAIAKVSKENGFTIVFDLMQNPIAYYNEATVIDVLPLVKKDLNLKDRPTTDAAAATAAPAPAAK